MTDFKLLLFPISIFNHKLCSSVLTNASVFSFRGSYLAKLSFAVLLLDILSQSD